MRLMNPVLSAFLLVISILGTDSFGQYVTESQRDIPLAYEVDVAIVGGTSYGVSAAIDAASQGAKVFLAAPRPYVGEDICATYRLWRENNELPETGLEKRLFSLKTYTEYLSLPFAYTCNQKSSPKHPDTAQLSLLNDKKWSSASNQSVQFEGNVTLQVELKETSLVKKIHLMGYQRAGDFEIKSVSFFISDDGQTWSSVGTVPNPQAGNGNRESDCIDFAAEAGKAFRFAKIEVEKADNVQRILLGEIVLDSAAKEPATKDNYVNPATPFQIKYGLEKALLESGVQFLYSCYVTEALLGENGQICGFVMTNRSGRQAVLAKTVIDASPRANFARLAGVKFTEYPSGKQQFKRIVVGGEPKTDSPAKWHKVPGAVISKMNDQNAQFQSFDAYEYDLEIAMPDGSFRSFAAAEQTARDSSWQPGQVDSSENLYQLPPDHAIADKASGCEIITDGILQYKNLYLIGPAVDSLDKTKDFSTFAWMRKGSELGKKAGQESKEIAKPSSVITSGEQHPSSIKGEVKELFSGIRNTQQGKSVISKEHALPILGEYDVVVIGGGTGGAPAGIASARQGSKTLVVEYLNGLGGIGTMGLIGSYYFGYREGFTKEVDAGVNAMKDNREKRTGWNVENKMEWYRSELRKAGAEIWFGVMGCGVLVEKGKVTGAVVATPQGRGVVLCKTLIDSTGNADAAAAAGAKTVFVDAETEAMQGTGLPPRMLGENYTNTDYTFIFDNDVLDLMQAFVAGKEKFKGAYDMAQIIDSRERRRIVGDFTISPLDILNQRRYPDTVSIGRSNFDSHGYTIHPYFAIHQPDKIEKFADTPYRALLPQGLDGIIVTGLGISAHRDAVPILRMQPCIQNQGYAMGIAASMVAKNGGHTRDLDIKALQKKLVEKGNLPERVLSDTDNYPFSNEEIADAVQNVVKNYQGLSVILAQPKESLPLLQEAYHILRKEQITQTVLDKSIWHFENLNPEQVKEAVNLYALIMGWMGDATGSESLIESIIGSDWDKGWIFTGMGQYGGSLSPLDSRIVALGKIRDTRGIQPILNKLAQLDSTKEFSHHRAVALALEYMGDPSAAKALAAHLRKPGMSGFAWDKVEQAVEGTPKGFVDDNTVRDRTLRELILARALYRCGDYEGVGEKILKAYSRDIRAYYSSIAQKVLDSKR